MASESKETAEAPLQLAIEALQARVRALSEYHSVYRTESCFRFWRYDQRRARELRHDMIRLQAWGWYLSLSARPPWWWRWLDRLASRIGRGQYKQAGQRRQRRSRIQRLSSFSIIDRAYAAHMETFQGQLLTLRLAQEHYLQQDREADRRHLEAAVAGLAEHRQCLARNAGRVTVICWTLTQVLRVRGWLMVDS